jgi:hypothetical protein
MAKKKCLLTKKKDQLEEVLKGGSVTKVILNGVECQHMLCASNFCSVHYVPLNPGYGKFSRTFYFFEPRVFFFFATPTCLVNEKISM